MPGALGYAALSLPSLLATNLGASTQLGKYVPLFKSLTCRKEGRAPRCLPFLVLAEALRCPMEGEGLLDRSHRPAGCFHQPSEAEQSHRCQARANAQYFTQLFLWWDQMAWYLGHLPEARHPLWESTQLSWPHAAGC